MSAPRSGLVAVLFTDLVGSTELMSQLGDRAFDDLRRKHFAALAKAVAAHGGEEVKNTGDGLMAVFPSAAEAVEAAVAMQQATARQAKNSPLTIRVGISVGDATFEDGDYFGTPVVEAARLVAAASPRQILVTQIARALAGTRSRATFTDRGPLLLKGMPEPVAVCEVGWEPAGSSVPMPSLLTDIGRVFVGRDGELERLAQLWKEAAAGDRRVALLAGEPGIGKTRLAAELASRVHGEGATVLVGRCDEDLGVPYQPFVEALRHFVDHTEPADLVDGLGRYGGELVRLLPELVVAVPELPPPMSSDPETERYRLFDAVAGWLASASASQPVLLVLDDLQWAAKPTLLLLRHLVSSLPAERLLILGTYRDSELVRDHPLVVLLADLRRREGIERLSLVGLDSSGVAAFLEQAAGHPLDDAEIALAGAIHQETEGNPFFVREVFRHLAEIGAVERRAGGWTTRLPVEELGIPESVREVIGRRLSLLSDEANRTLRTAAVVGSEFEVPVVQEAGGLDEDTVASWLEEALEARLVIATAGVHRYRFAHALVRDTLYGELTAARRVIVHRRVAEAIERLHAGRLDDYLPALAHHWGRASAPAADTARAADYAARAGDRALKQLAHDEAVAYYRQALELLNAGDGPPDESRRLELLISLGEAQRRAGEPGHRETLLEAASLAQQQGDTDALGRAALANSRGVMWSAVGLLDADRVAALEAALQVTDGGPIRARLLAILALELSSAGNRDRVVRLSDEALTLAREFDDPPTLCAVLLARAYALGGPPTLELRWSENAELVSVAEHLADPVIRSRALLLRTRCALERGDIGTADHCLDENSNLVEELRDPTLRWFVALQDTGRLLRRGRLADGERQAFKARDLGESAGYRDTDLFLAGQLFPIRAEQARLAEVQQLLETTAEKAPHMLAYRTMVALVYLETGRVADARDIFDELAADRFAAVPLDSVWLAALSYCGAICARLADTDNAAVLHDLLVHYPDQFAVMAFGVIVGSTTHYLGRLATTLEQWDAADGCFAKAAHDHERIGAPTWLAHTRLEWGRMLLTRRQPGDAARARELLGQALATARELGLANIERRAVELLQ